MQTKKLIAGMIAIVIAIILTVNVAAVSISEISHTTTTVENENPQWIRMAYLTDQTDYSVGYTITDSTITVTNGTDSQSGEVVDTILYADDTATVMVSDGTAHFLANVNDEDNYATLGTSFTIARSSGAVTVTDGDNSYNIGSDKTWVYIPLSTEKYGVFSTGNLNRYGGALAVAGSYAGVYCYNDICSQDLGLVMDAEYTDDYITSVKWALASAENVQEATEPTESVQNSNSIVLGIAPPSATYTDGDWGYELTGSNATIVSYSGATGGVLTVPATVGGYTVNSIGNGSVPIIDNTSTFTDVVISSGITTINAYAFQACGNITGTLTIPDTVLSIGMFAFVNCNKMTGALTLPNVNTISQSAFARCSSFTSLVLNGTVTIGNNAFESCTGFTGNLDIPGTVTTIGRESFKGCSGFNGNLTMHNGTTSIGINAFANCSGFTGSLVIPDSVTTIGGSAFLNCSGFTGSLVIPDSVTSIETSAFSGCSGFNGTLTLPDNLSSINNAGFQSCSGFTGSLVIPDSVTTIGSSAFNGCSGFTGSLVIPDSVTTIGTKAFRNCNGITDLIIMSDATPGTDAFEISNVNEVLNLGSAEYTTTSYGLTADSVQDHIDADSYLCITEVSETTSKEGAVYDLISIIPVLLVIGITIGAVRFIRQKN